MSIKLLVADDSITIQKVIGIIFGGDEYSLTIVDNGKDAIQKACDISPDVLLIDVLMPGMNGYEVCQTIRATPSLAAKPILMLTGSFEPFDEDRAKKCGADEFLAKPFESQQIIDKVKQLAELGQTRFAHAVAAEQTIITEHIFSSVAPADTIAPSKQPDISQSLDSSDIWGAFIPEPVTSSVTSALGTTDPASFQDTFEPDVFSIINDSDSRIVQSAVTNSLPDQEADTGWIPVEENIFEYEAEKTVDLPQHTFDEQTVPMLDPGFNDIVSQTEPAVQQPAVSAGTEIGALSEEQIKALILVASREVIERVVWEVVPDLAEAMIKDAIRKIKDGV